MFLMRLISLFPEKLAAYTIAKHEQGGKTLPAHDEKLALSNDE